MKINYSYLDKLEQIEKPMPHYNRTLSLAEKEDSIWKYSKGCDCGTSCKSCNNFNCQIKQFRKEMSQYKSGFCPGDYTKCARAKLQSCQDCRREHLDFSVLAGKSCIEIPQPIFKLKDPEMQKQIEELELLA